jgi:adenylate cyclase class 2
VREIEVKVRVPDLGPIRQRLLELGAVVGQERHHETNTLYDDRDRRLTGRREALRVRRIGRKTTLTFKGAPEKSRRFKIRPEFETNVQDRGALVKILRALGLVETVRYEKYRTVLRKGTLKICLDETAAGSFVEFEGDREKIVRMAKALGFPRKDWIKDDYVRLLAEAGKTA